MLDETTFRRHCDAAIEALKKSLIEAEEEGGFEVEEQNGVLNILFEEPPGKFVITPNTPPRQVWISALSTSFKLDWSDAARNFVLPKTGETLPQVVERVIRSIWALSVTCTKRRCAKRSPSPSSPAMKKPISDAPWAAWPGQTRS